MYIQELSTDEIKELIEDGAPLTIIDVRETEELETGTIPEAIHIPIGEIPFHIDALPTEALYIIICRAGNRSGRVTAYLESKGFQAINMAGGMLEWHGEKEYRYK